LSRASPCRAASPEPYFKAMSDVTSLRPALKLKHLYAALAALAAYLVTAVIGIWVGMTGGLVLQELGLFRKWAAHMALWKASLLFAGGLLAAVVWLYVLWRMRRPLILAAKMCWYLPKAYFVWGAGACGTVPLIGMMIVLSGSTIGLREIYIRFFPGILPEPLWLRGVIAGAGFALVGVCVVLGSLATKIALRVVRVDDWRASVARSLGKIDMLAAPAPAEGEA